MIKKYNQFVKENIELSNSSARIYIDSDEVEMFTTEPALQKLVSDRKVSLLPPELWFESEDKSTIDILKEYFPDVEFNTEYMGEEEDDKNKIHIPIEYSGVIMELGEEADPDDIISLYNEIVEEGTPLVSYSQYGTEGKFYNEDDDEIPTDVILDELNYAIGLE